jgi:hypothetical protein
MLENYDKNDIIKNDKYDVIEYKCYLYLDTGDEPDPREELMKLSKEELIELILKKN